MPHTIAYPTRLWPTILATLLLFPAGCSSSDDAGTGELSNDGGGANSMSGSADGTQSTIDCPTQNETTFSFFLMSREGLIRESGDPEGPGGNLGGLSGADGLCQKVAEFVSPCQAGKVWHAFLSTSTADAIDRIGQGPWKDRNGRLFANSLQELLSDRPLNAAAEIKNDFPNEYGILNSDPENTGRAEAVDNHQTLTGSGDDGRLYAQSTRDNTGAMGGTACGDGEDWSAAKATCWDWTSSEPQGCPRVGHSWPGMSGPNWISVWNEGGCAPGGNLVQTGGFDGTRRVGSAGGYGGFYCFAVTP
jgi:hypothetical protein